ncbi:MAG: hypothetical protein SFV54_11270 [Bryobacteraceae bacterium]|nr:hypothetical protein [Bryobacteraceae bacterium]
MLLPLLILLAVPVLAARAQSADICSLCHSRLSYRQTEVAPHALWKGSIMAKAAQDPYFLARVRYESNTAGLALDSKCLRCHAPAEPGGAGVNCSACHLLDTDFKVSARRQAFGPHERPFEMPMLHHTGLTPTHSPHILDSALCATCHTVVTHPLGTPEGTEFLEQAPYLEWLASGYSKEQRTCQSCHLPHLDGASYIAHRPPGGPFPPTRPRMPFGRHLFAGANYQVAPLAGADPGRALEQLQRSMTLTATERGPGEIAVTVTNLAGHKLPTAYPSRRLWLHVKAFDSAGALVFESGAFDRTTGELLAGAGFQAHYTFISSPRQVQIYEAEYIDASGRPTLSLVAAAAYRKDNRILPRGFDPAAGQRVLPVGTDSDAAFAAGSHTTRYRLPRSARRVEVEALYQSIKPAHLPPLGSLAALDPTPAVAAKTEIALR